MYEAVQIVNGSLWNTQCHPGQGTLLTTINEKAHREYEIARQLLSLPLITQAPESSLLYNENPSLNCINANHRGCLQACVL